LSVAVAMPYAWLQGSEAKPPLEPVCSEHTMVAACNGTNATAESAMMKNIRLGIGSISLVGYSLRRYV
jgi:hypothetical protein